MRLVITQDYNEMAEWGARYIKKRILDFNPGPDRYFVLGLPTGNVSLKKRQFSDLLVAFFKEARLWESIGN